MKRLFSFLFSAAAIVAWCTPGFAAAETVTSTGAGSAHNSEATGQGAGYFMQDVGAAYTLDVINGFQNINTGNLGGPFTNSAVDTDTASYANILFDAGDNSNVYGTIGASKQFLNITLTGNASVNFYGTVNTTTMDVGTGTASFLSGTMTNVVSGGATFTGAIGTGTIDLAANTGFTGAITTLNSGAGTLVLNNNTSVTGAVTGIGAITLPGTIVDTVSPTITGQVSAQTFNLGVNRLNVSGALTTGTSGAINTSLASTSLYGNIAATGNSALGTGLTVNVTPLQLVDIPAGTKFYLVTAPSGNAPTGLTVTDPANSSYTFTVAALAGQLTITSQTDIPATVLPPGVAPIVPVILIPNPSPVITNVQNSILALSTAEAISAIAQLGPSTPSLVAPQVTFQGAREF